MNKLHLRNFFSALLISTTGLAQNPSQLTNYCGTEVPSQQWEMAFQKLIQDQNIVLGKKSSPTVFTIPVIIHVIHGGQTVGQYPNLQQGQLVSQIQALNNDFGGTGYNSGVYNPLAFVNYAANMGLPSANIDAFGRVKIADCNVQFCLATKDTLGNLLAEPGIERINYVTKGWTNPGSVTSYATFKNLIDNTIKPQTIWNVSKYLNIWVTDENLNAIGLLGYATFPPISGLQGLTSSFGTATTDGLWCYSRAFGSSAVYPNGVYLQSNSKGRTCTHEIGHYLGLRHIWGDGACANDFCDDTPPATDKNFNSPTYPFKTTGCAGNTPDGEMFMNFMDYTADESKYMYTTDQATRIQTAMLNSPFRKFLGTHNLCNVEQIAAVANFSLPLTVCGSSAVVTLSNNTSGVPVPSYTWNVTGGAFISPGVNSPIAAMQFPASGVYTITLSADNGTLSTYSKVITAYVPVINIMGANPIECDGKEIILTATGSNNFFWAPSGVNSPTISFNASGVVTYTCIGEEAANCKITSVISITAMDCTSLNEISNNNFKMQAVPNPASGIVSVSLPGKAGELTLSDMTGKEIFKYQIEGAAKNQLIDLESLSKGIYFIQWHDKENALQAIKVVKE